MRLDQEIENLRADLIAAVQTCIQIKSVEDMEHASTCAPFGPGIKECLEWTLALGRKLGFEVKNIDGYAGQIEMGSGELVGILGHLDVVPEGDGWTVPPYSGEIRDGKIYGRGALDDKGPTLAALFAMKAIKDAKLPLNKRIRLILGTDEESGWADMAYYKQKEEIPSLGFAPDAEFPVIHAEKGILHLELSKNHKEFQHIIRVSGGERPNIVPDTCVVLLRGMDKQTIKDRLADFPFPEGVSAKLESVSADRIQILFRGISAHGSLPQNGKNAVLYALKFLQTLPLSEDEASLINWLVAHPGTGYYGEGMEIPLHDEPSGKLSLNVGILDLTAEQLRLVLDIRYPVTFNHEDVLTPLEKLCASQGITVKILTQQKAHYIPKDSPLVQALLKAYADVTGLEPYAFAIGGGTYAKVLPQGVAFGPVLPGQPELVHCPDEYISIDNLILTTKVYAQAILNLALDPSYRD